MGFFQSLFLLQNIDFLKENPDISLRVISYLDQTEYSLYVTTIKPMILTKRTETVKKLYDLLPSPDMRPVETLMSKQLEHIIDKKILNFDPYGKMIKEIAQYLLDSCVYSIYLDAQCSFPLPIYIFELKDASNRYELRQKALSFLNHFLTAFFRTMCSIKL